MGLRSGLDAVTERKNPCPCRESNPGRCNDCAIPETNKTKENGKGKVVPVLF